VKKTLSAALTGILAGALTVGVATLLAGLLARIGAAGGTPSPVLAVGAAFIDRTPPWLKNAAIATFGTHDKQVLLISMAVVIFLGCAVVGILAARRLTLALLVFALIAALGLGAVVTRPHASPIDALPTIVAALTGLWALSKQWEWRARTPAPVGDGPARREVLRGSAGLAAAALGTAAVGQAAGGKAASVAQARASVHVPTVMTPVTIPAGASLKVPGITPYVVNADDFYRIDTALVVPQVSTSDWRLKVHGMVDHEVSIDWKTLLSKPLQQALVTLTCVSNEVGGDLAGNAVWTGWPIRELLAMASPKAGADMVLSTSADGWTAGTPLTALTDSRNALLAVAMNGKPLPVEHGFPVRMVVPGLYGYVSATKWVTDLEVTRFADAQGYWTPRGWSALGPVKTESRIDVPSSGKRVKAGKVAVAGVAWAQHRGIAKVEVRVDDQPWQQATLALEPTIDSWRQWVLPWQATRGSHTLTVRATDMTGAVQTSQSAPPEPNGATGWHSVTVTVD
jgi:DMSO/TMAO reductase YedYZ molybdopterin-dependent catalytic subunit